MAVTIIKKRVEATIENGVWTCPDAGLLDYVRAVGSGCPRMPGWDQDEFQALWVSNRIGGAVLPRSMPAPPVSPPRLSS
jgi:hypothetical protein